MNNTYATRMAILVVVLYVSALVEVVIAQGAHASCGGW